MAGVTSADVARESGVSRTTVSYVLNGTEGTAISEATRRRVLEAAQRLGYAPSAAARTLRRGRSDLVLCVLPDLPVGPVIDSLLERLATDLTERGLAMLVHHDRGRRPLAELWRTVTPHAVIGLMAFEDADVVTMRQAGIKVVTSTLDADPDPDAFSVPQTQIGALQLEHLASRGHSRIGYALPTDPRLAGFADRRLAGVREACDRLGLVLADPLPVALGVEEARAAVTTWREADVPVTAVAAYNDEVALAVLAGARAAGLGVPADLAVIGVDDIPTARLAAPALTTVWQAIDAQADYLAETVLARLDDEEPRPTRPDDLFGVVAREST